MFRLRSTLVRRPAVALALVALAGVAARPVHAQYQAFSFSSPPAGNQAFTGPLGIDFTVGAAPIQVTAFGAFADGQNGFAGPITVRLYNRATQTVVQSLIFAPGATGTPVGGYRFLSLGLPLGLAAGFQGTIVASGYGAGDLDYNSAGDPFPGTVTTGGLVSFVGSSRFGADPNAYPTTMDTGPEVRYGAGNFVFRAVSASTVPEPSTYALLAAGLGGVGLLARRRTRA